MSMGRSREFIMRQLHNAAVFAQWPILKRNSPPSAGHLTQLQAGCRTTWSFGWTTSSTRLRMPSWRYSRLDQRGFRKRRRPKWQASLASVARFRKCDLYRKPMHSMPTIDASCQAGEIMVWFSPVAGRMAKEFKKYERFCTAAKVTEAAKRCAKVRGVSTAKPPASRPAGRVKTIAVATPQMMSQYAARAAANAAARAADSAARAAEHAAIISQWDAVQLECGIFGIGEAFGTFGVPDPDVAGGVFNRLLQLHRRADRAAPYAADENADKELRAIACAISKTVTCIVGEDGCWAGQPWAQAYNRNEVSSSQHRARMPSMHSRCPCVERLAMCGKFEGRLRVSCFGWSACLRCVSLPESY